MYISKNRWNYGKVYKQELEFGSIVISAGFRYIKRQIGLGIGKRAFGDTLYIFIYKNYYWG